MRIALYHGYELTGSGSNEYNRYLSRALMRRGHDVHVLCREPEPASIEHVGRAFDWRANREVEELFARDVDEPGSCTLHRLPHASTRPVYLTDKQRPGAVKAFPDLTDAELEEVVELDSRVVEAILRAHPVDVLHANHVVIQPVVAANVARRLPIPFVVFPHGSAIEYVLRRDPRLLHLARMAWRAAASVISGNDEVLDRVLALDPDHAEALQAKSAIVGVGVDTTLFQPLTRADRSEALHRLAASVADTGRGPADTVRLLSRLEQLDFDSLAERPSYADAFPDADAKEKLASIDPEAPILLFVGALTSGKGLQTLLTAMPALLARCPAAQLVLVGSGRYREPLEAWTHALSRADDRWLDALLARGFDLDDNDLHGPWPDVAAYVRDHRDLLRTHGPLLEGRVHFLGRLDHGRLRHLFPCADLAVFPSVVPEAYPLVLMEALANGVLPVVSDFSGFADGLDRLTPHLGSAWTDRMRLPMEPAVRVAALAERLASLLDDPQRASLGPRLRQIAVERYDWSIRAAQMEAVYERVQPS